MLQWLIILTILVIYLYFKWHLSFFVRRGITGPRPLPLIGNMWNYVTMKKHFGEVYEDIYRSNPKANYVGIYKMHRPTVLVRDLDVVKDVLAGDFSSFHDNDFDLDPKLDTLSVINPFFAKGDAWKGLRSQISPIFTYSKIKGSFPIIEGVCKTLVDWIEKGPEAKNPNGIATKSLGEMYTMDVVASAAFGVEAQSFTDKQSPFRELIADMISPTFANIIKGFVIFFMPKLISMLRISFMSRKHENWVRSFVDEVIKRRTELGEKRQDFLQNFLDLQKKNENAYTTDDIVPGQAVLFLAEGTETSSATIAFALYELARHPDIARQAQEEVDAVYERHGGKLTEEGILELEYLEQVVLETLRLHSVVYAITRMATKDYTFPPQFPGSSQRLSIPKGTSVIIPVAAIHYDSEHYPNPYSFDPSRFGEAKRKERNKYAYLGFSEGPRICLGQKFALFQVRAALSAILRNFNMSLSRKTHDPLILSKKSIMKAAEGGLWVNFEKRESVN